MRAIMIGACFAGGLTAGLAPAVGASDPALAGLCLSAGASLEAVTSHQVVAPGQAIVLARRAAPNADVLRAALCEESEGLAYRIVLLRKDGRLVRVTIDAPSGKIKSVH